MLALRGIASERGVTAAARQSGCGGIGERLLASLAAALRPDSLHSRLSARARDATAPFGNSAAAGGGPATAGASSSSMAANSGSGGDMQSAQGPPAAARGFAHATAAAERDPRFNSLTDADLDRFRQILGGEAVVTDPEQLHGYNRCCSLCVLRQSCIVHLVHPHAVRTVSHKPWHASHTWLYASRAMRRVQSIGFVDAVCCAAPAAIGWKHIQGPARWRCCRRPRSRCHRSVCQATSFLSFDVLDDFKQFELW